MKVRIVVTGRSYDQHSELPETLELSDGSTIRDAIQQIEALSTSLPATCLVSFNGQHLGTLGQFSDAPLSENGELVLIQPVAGG